MPDSIPLEKPIKDFTREERLQIIVEARQAARELVKKLERLAELEGGPDDDEPRAISA